MKKILALTLVLVMVLALCACGDGSKMAGTWELTAMTSDGEDYYATLKEYGITVVLQLNEDGTGYLDVGGEKEDITWSGSSITIDGERDCQAQRRYPDHRGDRRGHDLHPQVSP